MSPTALPTLFFTAIFSTILIVIGLKMFRIRSYEQHLLAYKRNPQSFGSFEKYFLGWRFGNFIVTEWSIKVLGDRLVTAFYRFTGILFIIVAAMFIAFAVLLSFRQ